MDKENFIYNDLELPEIMQDIFIKIPDVEKLLGESPDVILEKDKPYKFRGVRWGQEDFQDYFFEQ